MDADELRATFVRAQAIGLLEPEALRAARARVEWRPSRRSGEHRGFDATDLGDHVGGNPGAVGGRDEGIG